MFEIHYGILLAQCINFLVLFYIFHRFVGKKLSKAMEDRKKQLEKLQLAEKHYQEKMELAQKQSDEILKEAKNHSQKLLEESRTMAKISADNILKEAHNDALAVLDSGKREIQKERISMLQNVKKHILDMSLKINKKMLESPTISVNEIKKEIDAMK